MRLKKQTVTRTEKWIAKKPIQNSKKAVQRKRSQQLPPVATKKMATSANKGSVRQ